MDNDIVVGVIGSGDDTVALSEAAKEVGALVAKAGYTLINGGLGGVMEASALGAKEAGGLTIGILPGADKAEANPYIDIAIPSGMGDMRNALIVRSSTGLIAVGGALGTLSEIAFALKAGKPVVSIGSWDVSEKIIKAGSAKDAFEKLAAIITKG